MKLSEAQLQLSSFWPLEKWPWRVSETTDSYPAEAQTCTRNQDTRRSFPPPQQVQTGQPVLLFLPGRTKHPSSLPSGLDLVCTLPTGHFIFPTLSQADSNKLRWERYMIKPINKDPQRLQPLAWRLETFGLEDPFAWRARESTKTVVAGHTIQLCHAPPRSDGLYSRGKQRPGRWTRPQLSSLMSRGIKLRQKKKKICVRSSSGTTFFTGTR